MKEVQTLKEIQTDNFRGLNSQGGEFPVQHCSQRVTALTVAYMIDLCCIKDHVRLPVDIPVVSISDASISRFQFRYDIDTIFTKYRSIDINIKYVNKMHTFCRLKY